VDDQLTRQRKAAFRSYQKLTPPRVLRSDGEAVAGAHRRGDLPAGALVGLPVSTGTIAGRLASSWCAGALCGCGASAAGASVPDGVVKAGRRWLRAVREYSATAA